MKYCPLCRAGYREGRLTCATCGTNLIDSLDDTDPAVNAHLLWSGRDPVEFDLVVQALRQAQIPVNADPGLGGLLGALLSSQSKIHVLRRDFHRALEIAAAAIASRTAGRAPTQICHSCSQECSASLTACPKCRAVLIIEAKKDLGASATIAASPMSARKYCPLCDAAYSEGHRRCTVCGVELVPEELRGTPLSERERNEKLEIVWRGGDPLAVSEVITVLREAGIRHHVQPTNDHLVFELAMPRPKYLLRVFASDAARARELVSGIREIPLFGGLDEFADEPKDPTAEHHAKRPWNPAAANVEIWSGEDAALAQLLEDCLRENQIGARRAGRQPGLVRLYVMKVDEGAAREIVREVREGAPPA